MELYLPFIWPLISAAILSFILTPFVKELAIRWKVYDQPGERKVHKKPVPRLGGLAFILSFLIIIAAYLIFKPWMLVFWKERYGVMDKHLLGYLLGALVIVGAGVWDDIRGMKPIWKFFWQVIAALVVVGFGVGVGTLSNPFGEPIQLTSLRIPVWFGQFSGSIVVWADLVALIWILIVVNVVNWLDGLDGLAAGVSAIAAVTLFFLSLTLIVNQPAVALICIILAGALIGFLPYNFHPAKIFMGDAGSMFLGFTLAVFAIISGGKIATAALVLGFPILDGIWVVSRRILAGRPPWIGDKKHLHHRFLSIGFSQRRTVLILYFIAALFGAVALVSGTREKFWAFLWLLLVMVILAWLFLILEIRKRRKLKTQNSNVK